MKTNKPAEISLSDKMNSWFNDLKAKIREEYSFNWNDEKDRMNNIFNETNKKILERIENLNETLRKDNTIWRMNQDELNDLWERQVKEIIKSEMGGRLTK